MLVVYTFKIKEEGARLTTLPALISIITVLIGLFISGKALLSKTGLEQVFFTHEQKIKTYLLKLIGVSLLTAFLVGDLYVLWNLTFRNNIETTNWNYAFGLSIIVFIFSIIFYRSIDKIIKTFFKKHHFKFKVNLEKIGEVYIVRMMNKEICICSKDPNAEILKNEDFILVKLEDLIQTPFIKEKIATPKISIWEKIFDL